MLTAKGSPPAVVALFEAGRSAQEDGYDAVCIDTMSDSGVNALRSVLDIPVIGPGRCSYLTALMLGVTSGRSVPRWQEKQVTTCRP